MHESSTSPIWLALIADMVGSRELEDIEGVLRQTRAALDTANAHFAEAIASRFVLTVGDEFQALLATAAPLVDVLTTFEHAIDGVTLRWGASIGPITSGPLQPDAIGMYGPCFTEAREAIERAKADGLPLAFGPRVHAEAPGAALVEAAWAGRGALRERWNDAAHDAVGRLRAGAPTQRAVAEAMDVTPQSISRTLDRARWVDVHRIEQATAGWAAAIDLGRSDAHEGDT